MCLINKDNSCVCPPKLTLDDLPIKPFMRTPLDKLGFPEQCCYCCKLRIATVFICILSFLWGAYEVQSSDKLVAIIFSEKNNYFYITYFIFLILSFCFILATGALLLGILIKREELLVTYVWCGFVYNCITIVLIITIGLTSLMRAKKPRITLKLIFGIIWCSLYFYLLMVVNSYKLTLW